MNGMVSWPVSRSVGRLVDGMVDWAVWLVVIGGWRRQIILSYKITNNIIGVLRANSLVARWPGVCIVYRTSQHDRCGAPLGPFGFVFVFRKNVFRFYFYWFGFFLISLFHFPNFVICFIHGTSDESDASNLLVVPGTALPVKPPPPAALTHLRSTHCLSSLELLKVLQQLPERLRNALCGIAPPAFLRIRLFSFVLNMKSHKHMFC